MILYWLFTLFIYNKLYDVLVNFSWKERVICMKIILSIILIGALGAGFAFSLRRNQNDIGGGLGKDYMKNHWGIDDDK